MFDHDWISVARLGICCAASVATFAVIGWLGKNSK